MMFAKWDNAVFSTVTKNYVVKINDFKYSTYNKSQHLNVYLKLNLIPVNLNICCITEIWELRKLTPLSIVHVIEKHIEIGKAQMTN